ncbi:hypothetical protein D3C73_937440 [compost metagenome]
MPAVKINVLGAVDDVEPGDPEHNDRTDDERRKGDIPGHCEPGADWCRCNNEAQVQVAEERKPFGIRIRRDQDNRHR